MSASRHLAQIADPKDDRHPRQIRSVQFGIAVDLVVQLASMRLWLRAYESTA
jgi:hypothetical protein